MADKLAVICDNCSRVDVCKFVEETVNVTREANSLNTSDDGRLDIRVVCKKWQGNVPNPREDHGNFSWR